MQPMNRIALCSSTRHSAPHRVALCAEIALTDAAPPAEVELIPAPDADGMVVGRDGRRWVFDASARNHVLQNFASAGLDVVVDRDHASELKAPLGDESPAAAWITKLHVTPEGALRGTASWTPRAASQIADREYRYLSPAFDYDPASKRITRLVSVGLTNRPNLRVPALNSQESLMDKLHAAIATALGLPDTATVDEAVAAIGKLRGDLSSATTAMNSATPPLDRFVPRADFDALATRATNAEQRLREHADNAHKAAVETEIDAALKAGKIPPASVDYHRACCATAQGLDAFRAYVGAAPVIAPDSASKPGAPPSTTTALNADEQRICELAGISHDAFREAARARAVASA